MHRHACARSCAGFGHDIRLLASEHTVWDAVRGKGLPKECLPEATDTRRLDHLANQFIQSKWAPATRLSYNAWFRTWREYCELNMTPELPAQEVWLLRYFTYLACFYSAGTVEIAAASLAAVHRINGLPSPTKSSVAVADLLASIKKNGIVSTRAKKLVVDAPFIVKMCTAFLDEYPVYDPALFNPAGRVRSDTDRSIMWLRGLGMILLGLSLGLRAGEVTKLTLCCWEHREYGSAFVHVKLAKNGQNGVESGAYLHNDHLPFAETFSAIAFFEEFWFPFLQTNGFVQTGRCTHLEHPTAHCLACPPLFPTWPKRSLEIVNPIPGPISTSGITDVVKKWAARIGRESSKYSAISFRRGSVSLAAAEKVARNIRQKQGRWRSSHMPDHYTEVTVEEQLEFGKALSQQIRRSKANAGKQVGFTFRQ